MKTCPYCAEEIQEAAIKCKHCMEFLDGASRASAGGERVAWYFRTPFVVIALCCVGPLALPLIWWRPKTAMAWKLGLTVGVLLLSWVLYLMTLKSISMLQQCYEMIETF
jgi:hypothetical protein